MKTRYKAQTFQIWKGPDGATIDLEITPPDDLDRQALIINVRTQTGRIKAKSDIETILEPDLVIAATMQEVKRK